MKTKVLYTLLFFTTIIYAQRTYMPDDVFEARIIQMGGDDVLDDYVPTSTIANIKTFHLSGVTDPTGIEDFAMLETLNFGNGNIQNINLSELSSLKHLDLSSNKLLTLDVGLLVNLEYLTVVGNEISNINVAQNNELVELHVSDNKLKSLNTQYNGKLERLSVGRNLLTTLDISSNTRLTNFNARQMNSLTSLNMSNINYDKLFLDIRENPNLFCVTVTDVEKAFDEFLTYQQKDIQTGFSLDCSATTNILDSNFEQALIDLGYDSGTPDGKILSGNVSSITTLTLQNKGIADLTGLEAFISLENLSLRNNNLTSVDFSTNPKLKIITLDNNQITDINVSKNLILNNLSCNTNSISSLNLKNNRQLEWLYLNTNKLSELDVAENTKLIALEATDNELININLSKNTKLERLNLSNNKLESLNVKNGNNTAMRLSSRFKTIGNENLFCITVDDASYSIDKWFNIDDHTSFTINCEGVNKSFISDVVNPGGMVIIDNYLYFTQKIDNNSGKISKVDLSLETPIIVDVITDLNEPVDLVADDDKILYVLERLGGLYKVDLKPTNPVKEFIVDPTGNSSNRSTNIALEGNYVYISLFDEGKVVKVNITDNFPTTASDFLTVSSPGSLEIYNGYLYYNHFIDGFGNRLSRQALNAKGIQASIVVDKIDYLVDFKIVDNIVYMSQGNTEAKVSTIDLTQTLPAIPTDIISNIDFHSTNLAIHNNTLFLATHLLSAGRIQKFNTNVLSTSDLEQLNKSPFTFKLYPNPSNNFINISSLNTTIDAVEIYNYIGKKVLVNKKTNRNQLKINTSQFSSGIYYVKIYSENKITTKKFIKN